MANEILDPINGVQKKLSNKGIEYLFPSAVIIANNDNDTVTIIRKNGYQGVEVNVFSEYQNKRGANNPEEYCDFLANNEFFFDPSNQGGSVPPELLDFFNNQITVYSLYELINAPTISGSLQTQAGISIIRDSFEGADLLVSKVGADQYPTLQNVIDSDGRIVTANFNPVDTPPDWQLDNLNTNSEDYCLFFKVRGTREALTEYLSNNTQYFFYDDAGNQQTFGDIRYGTLKYRQNIDPNTLQAGEITFNNDNPDIATICYTHNETIEGVQLNALLALIEDRKTIFLQDRDSYSGLNLFKQGDAIDQGNFFEIPLISVSNVPLNFIPVDNSTVFSIQFDLLIPLGAYPNGYTFRRRISVEPQSVQGTNDMLNYPLLVKATFPELASVENGGKVENSNDWENQTLNALNRIADISFWDEAGVTQYNHEIVSYDPTTGFLYAYVQVPVLSASVTTVIYLYYGNSSVTTNQENITAVWQDNEIDGISWDWGNIKHLNHPIIGETNPQTGVIEDFIPDSSGNNGHVNEFNNMDADLNNQFASSLHGNGISVQAPQWMRHTIQPSEIDFAGETEFTIMHIVNYRTVSNDGSIILKADANGGAAIQYSLGCTTGGGGETDTRVDSSGGNSRVNIRDIIEGQFQVEAFRVSIDIAPEHRQYINGVLAGSTNGLAGTIDAKINNTQYFKRFSTEQYVDIINQSHFMVNVAIPVEWLLTMQNMLLNIENFVTIGAEQNN